MPAKELDIQRLKKRLREAKRAQRELEKRMFHLKTLYDLSREIGFLIDTQAIMQNLLLMVIGTFGTFRGLILLVDTERGSVEGFIQRGLDEHAIPALDQMGEQWRLAEIMEHPRGVEIAGARSDPAADGSRAVDEFTAALHLHAWLPFTVNQQLKGVIGLGEKMTGESYTVDDLELLTTLANQAAVAIQNATAHEKLVRYAEELATSLKRIQMLESIKSNLGKFVPKTVRDLIEESPDAPSLDKREIDVSVLFADITGYTRLSAELDLERVNQLVEVYFGAFLDEIVKRGGEVSETAGDGLMVIFRDPDPCRHAAAAVLTALAIQHRTQEINATLEGFFEPIAMHIGVNSGIAAVGATKIEGAAGTRWIYTASGPTTNVASRVSALAEGGAVVISEETRRRLDDSYALDDLGPQSLKNVPQPVRVYRLQFVEAEASAVNAVRERRLQPRRAVAWPVRLWLGKDGYDALAVDASLHGIRITNLPVDLLTVGKSYELEIQTGADTVVLVVADIRHLGDQGVGMETSEPLPVG